MATEEVTGATIQELAEMEFKHKDSRKFKEDGIPFEVAYCTTPIGRQPEDYDGPRRYCKNRVARVTEEEWAERYDGEIQRDDRRSYHPACRFHGRSCNGRNADNLEEPGLAPLKHGMYAEDWRLREDFSEADEQLFDSIMGWATVYGWPPREEDPARYDLLEQFAYERVRSVRGAEYLDEEGEVQMREIYDDSGVKVAEVPEENTLSEQLRLQRKLLIDYMKELGLSPKSRGELDAMESQSSAAETVASIAKEALGGEHTYDPSEFEDDGS